MPWSPEPVPEMHHRVPDSQQCHPAPPSARGPTPPPLENTMMNRIRTAIETKRAAEQLQAYYMWRPGPGRR